ncbi:hypothetical protein [Aquimarina agarivorans]|nr:hypothetical protein [Aquimarina agarivorans]
MSFFLENQQPYLIQSWSVKTRNTSAKAKKELLNCATSITRVN